MLSTFESQNIANIKKSLRYSNAVELNSNIVHLKLRFHPYFVLLVLLL